MVSIAAYTNYSMPGCGAHLYFHGLKLRWASTHCYFRGFYTLTKLYRLVSETHGCEQLAQGYYPTARLPDGTHDH